MVDYCFEQVKNLLVTLPTLNKSKNVGYFADFEQVKKQPYNETPLGETGCLSNFLGNLSMPLALHPGFSGL